MMVALPSGVSRGGNEEGLSGGASSKSRSRSPMLDMAGFCSRLVEFFSPGQPALTHLLLPPPPLPPVELQTSGWAGLIQLLGVAWAEGSGKGSCRGLTEGLGRGWWSGGAWLWSQLASGWAEGIPLFPFHLILQAHRLPFDLRKVITMQKSKNTEIQFL